MIFLALLLLLDPVPEPSPGAQKVLAVFDRLRSAEAVQFRLAESDLNEYLRYSLVKSPRFGISSAQIRILPSNRFSTSAVIDFDAIERSKPGAIPAILRPVLAGSRDILFDFRLNPKGGAARVVVERAAFEGFPVPTFLAERLFALIAARQKEHYDTTRPLPLPMGIQTVWTVSGFVMGMRERTGPPPVHEVPAHAPAPAVKPAPKTPAPRR